mgnify:CR=1 FL=1
MDPQSVLTILFVQTQPLHGKLQTLNERLNRLRRLHHARQPSLLDKNDQKYEANKSLPNAVMQSDHQRMSLVGLKSNVVRPNRVGRKMR